MDIGIIAKRYAKSLFAFATENHDEEAVYQAMLTLVNSYQKVEQLHPTLLNPVLTSEKREAILLAASVGKGEKAPVSLSRFVQLVVSHKARRNHAFHRSVLYPDLPQKPEDGQRTLDCSRSNQCRHRGSLAANHRAEGRKPD